jgi:[ribosomal protein S18]-alanine N-acetyltransferase
MSDRSTAEAGTARTAPPPAARRRPADPVDPASAPAPGVRLIIRPMIADDLPAVQAIERASFTTPWPPHAYRQELETNRLAHYLTAMIGETLVGYGGIWLMVDEAHITTFAIHPVWRRRHIGERLLLALLDLALEARAREATLEVRISNLAARRLYEKYGFRPVGIRPRYYSDNGEDALIMTTEELGSRPMRDRIRRLRGALEHRPGPYPLEPVSAASSRATGTAAPQRTEAVPVDLPADGTDRPSGAEPA